MPAKKRKRPSEPKTSVCQVMIPAEMNELITLEAQTERRSFDWVVNEALKDYFKYNDRRKKKRHPALR